MPISTDDLKDIPHVVTITDHEGLALETLDFEGTGCMEAAHLWAQTHSMQMRGVVVTVACRVRRITTPPAAKVEPVLEHESVYIGKLKLLWREYWDQGGSMEFEEWLREACYEFQRGYE
jgi:hypothetical protein